MGSKDNKTNIATRRFVGIVKHFDAHPQTAFIVMHTNILHGDGDGDGDGEDAVDAYLHKVHKLRIPFETSLPKHLVRQDQLKKKTNHENEFIHYRMLFFKPEVRILLVLKARQFLMFTLTRARVTMQSDGMGMGMGMEMEMEMGMKMELGNEVGMEMEMVMATIISYSQTTLAILERG